MTAPPISNIDMADLMVIQLAGVAETVKVLNQLPAVLRERVYLQSLRKGATLIRDEVRLRAPYGSDFKRRAFTKKNKKGVSRTELVKLRNEVKMSTALKTDVSFNIQIGVGRAYWGMFQEFGTSRMASRPWMRPAFDATALPAITLSSQELGKGLEREAKKLAGSLSKSGLLRRRR